MPDSFQPIVSVIVPVYNSEGHLHRCIDSILASTDKEIEIILINDGSSDKSGNICDEYATKCNGIKVCHQKNGGVSAARNRGLELAAGKWIYFVDSDDWLEEDGLTKLIKMTEKYPEVELIRCFSREVHNGFSSVNPLKPEMEVLFTRDDFLRTNLLGGYIHSLFITKAIIDKYELRFTTYLGFFEDLEFTFVCVLNCKWILVYNHVLYNYKIHSDSSARNMSVKMINDYLISTSRIYKYAQNYKCDAVDSMVISLLNSSLTTFFSDIARYDKISDVSSKETRAVLSEFVKGNNLNINNLKAANSILAGFALIDVKIIIFGYRIFKQLNRLKFRHNGNKD